MLNCGADEKTENELKIRIQHLGGYKGSMMGSRGIFSEKVEHTHLACYNLLVCTDYRIPLVFTFTVLG